MVAPLTVSDLLGRLGPVPSAREAAAHAWRVLHLEHRWGLDVEHLLVRVPSTHPALFSAASTYYASMHFVVTTVAALAVAVLRPAWWAALRTSFVVGSVAALVISRMYPMMPPNLLGTAAFSGVADASHPPNIYAAMPSTHTFWAVWSLVALAVAVWPRCRAVRVPVLALGVGHLAATVLIVLSLGHHMVLDVMAGAALVAAGGLTAALLPRQLDLARGHATRRGAPVAERTGTGANTEGRRRRPPGQLQVSTS